MRFDKKVFLDNLDLFMSEKAIKARDLEETAKVSRGYISRMKKEDNQSIPGIDFLLTVSSMFGISIEALSTINFALCTDNEKYYLGFLDSLINRTVKGELLWKKHSFKENKKNNDRRSEEDLFFEQGPSLVEVISSSIAGKKKYKSSFEYGKYNCIDTEGDFFSLDMDASHLLYIVKVILAYEEETLSGIEMFITTKNERKSNVCCVTPQNPQKYDALLFRLYEIVKDSISVNHIDKETKAVIDKFMNN